MRIARREFHAEADARRRSPARESSVIAKGRDRRIVILRPTHLPRARLARRGPGSPDRRLDRTDRDDRRR